MIRLSRIQRHLSGVGAYAIGALLLCAVALANGGPLIYPDTANYLADGHALVRLSAPGNTRPVFYGLAIEFLHWERTIWPVLLAQSLVLVHLIDLTARAIGAELRKVALLGLLAFLVIVTPVSWYVSHVLPDVFTGVVVLGLFLLGCCRDRLSLVETAYLVVLAAAALSFHLSHLVVGGAICVACTATWTFCRERRGVIRPILAATPLLLAVFGLLLFSEVLYQRLSFTPKSPPHLMARLIADGPGRDYLRLRCAAEHYYLCDHLDQLPHTENGILWRYMARLSPEDHGLVVAEAGEIVRGTIWTYPGPVVLHMLTNTARQLITISSGMEFDDNMWRYLKEHARFIADPASNSLQLRGVLDEAVLAPVNAFHEFVAGVSLVLGLLIAWWCLAARLYRPAMLIGTVLVALLANAFATGALGGVFGRYQGRLIWLLPFSVCVAGFALLWSRRMVPRTIGQPDAAGLARPILKAKGLGSA